MNRVFLDSNILLYFYSKDDVKKKFIVDQLLQELKKDGNAIISTQVLFEFSHVMRKKFGIDYQDIKEALHEFNTAFTVVTITFNTMQQALDIASRYKYSFPDSLIIAAALENRCTALYSEDMAAGNVIEKLLTIKNPF
jgi:predicted nucleic acid-binding protein